MKKIIFIDSDDVLNTEHYQKTLCIRRMNNALADAEACAWTAREIL